MAVPALQTAVAGGPPAVDYLPIVTTLVAAAFSAALFRRYRERRSGPHLLWWAFGVAVYGVGTFTEAATTLAGWHEAMFRAWYVSGALLGGAPLAQGTAYLLLKRRTADWLTVGLLAAVAIAAWFVWRTPIAFARVEPHHLTGQVFASPWPRVFAPFLNTYAFVLLVGGAALSAWRFRRRTATRNRFVGNVLIAVGALLPGIGGAATRYGYTEVLYVTELVGLVLIYLGYRQATTKVAGASGEGSGELREAELRAVSR